MAQVIGAAKIRINGSEVALGKASVTLTLGGPVREEVEGDHEAGNWKKSTKAGRVEFSALAKPPFDPMVFRDLEGAVVGVDFDNGDHYMIRDAASEEAPQISTDGTYKCVAFGKPAVRIS